MISKEYIQMTDDETINVLEYCYKKDECGDCLLNRRDYKCTATLQKNTLNLINRYKKENEKLRSKIAEMELELDKQYDIAEASIRANIADGGISCRWCENTLKVQTIKEFSKRFLELYSGEIITDEMVCPVGNIKANIKDIEETMIGEINCKND